ncbi:MAG TPA: TlpA disulfide reductase family protein [Acidimicrobiales bacterium]|nr:TlpA disulfide reductase family protein [Acidimicrobiales bacterium]
MRWAALGIGVAGAALVAVLSTRPPAQVAEAASPIVGQPAPPTAGTDIGGGRFSLTDLRGRFVVVNFFASWCGPCHQELPQLVAMDRSGTAVVGVVFSDSAGSARRFLTGGGAHWPALDDGEGALALAWGVRAPPESFLVSPDGAVLAKVIGPLTPNQVGYFNRVIVQARRAGL